MDVGLQLGLPGLSHVTTGHEKTRVHLNSVLEQLLLVTLTVAAASCEYGSDVGQLKVSQTALEQL